MYCEGRGAHDAKPATQTLALASASAFGRTRAIKPNGEEAPWEVNTETTETYQAKTKLRSVVYNRPALFGEADDTPVHLPLFCRRHGRDVAPNVSVPVCVAIALRSAVTVTVGQRELLPLPALQIPPQLPARKWLHQEDTRHVAQDGHDGNGGDDEPAIEKAGAIVVALEERVGVQRGRGGVRERKEGHQLGREPRRGLSSIHDRW